MLRGMAGGAGLMDFDVGWWLREFALGFNETGLEADNVVA